MLVKDNGTTKKIATNFMINNSKEIQTEIESILGKNSIMFEKLDNS